MANKPTEVENTHGWTLVSPTDDNLTSQHEKRALSPPGEFKFPTVSVIIPTLEEEKNLPYILPFIPEWVYEVILVDGCSTDNTVATARQLRPDIRVVMEQRRGKGVALQTGFAAAQGEIIVMLDADCSNDPMEIYRYVGVLMSGADFAKGSRFLQGGGTNDMPFYRKVGNWGFVKTVQLLFGGSYSDLCYGYNAFWTRILPKLNLDADGFEFETVLNIRALVAGIKIVEVPSFENKRVYGSGRLRTVPDGWRVFKAIWREWLAAVRWKDRLLGWRNSTLGAARFFQRRLQDNMTDE